MSNSPLNRLSLPEKKRLLSLAKQLKKSVNRHDGYARQANNIFGSSGISLTEYGMQMTPASRNIGRQIKRLENMMNYTQIHAARVAQKIVKNFPAVVKTGASHNNIIRNTEASIIRHVVTPNIVSGKYETRGKQRWKF